MHKFISLDTETTGVDFSASQVIQCGIILLDKYLQPFSRKSWNINYVPENFSWSNEAAEIHKISKEEALVHGISPEVFLKEIEQSVISHYGTSEDVELHIIAANAYFDYLMLERIWSEYRKDVPLPFSRRVMDLSSLGLLVVGDAGVTTLIEKLGIPVDEDKQHDALYDAELHLKIFHSLATIARHEGISLY